MLESFTIDTFAGRIGEGFKLRTDEATAIDTTLVEARTWGGEAAADRHRVPFSLLFRGPPRPVLPQRIYRMEHADLGAFDLFIVPIGPDGEGMRYEAVFS